jgi:PDZ domain-containing protein
MRIMGMMRKILSHLNLRIPLGGTAIILEASWLVIVPVGLWVIGTIFVPTLGAPLTLVQTWAVTGLIALFAGISLFSHVLAHIWAARMNGSELPASIGVYLLGDAAQIWPAAGSAWKETLVALAGPFANLVLAGVAYLFWNAQLNPYLNTSMLFFGFFNAWLMIVNLTSGFPFDGGRLARAIVWGLLERPAAATKLGTRLGYLVSAVLTGWGIFLMAQNSRFHWETGAATVALAGLVFLALRMQPAWKWERLPTTSSRVSSPSRMARTALAGLLLISLLGLGFSLVPTNDGLEAPGVALPVRPMVEVPSQYRYPSAGSFILTTVIPQAPITTGEWVFGQLSPVVRIVPAEQIVPEGTTPQELARQGFQMLDQSETAAIVVGLRLAGFPVKAEGKGVLVASILADSPSNGVLQPGDVITGLNGEAITTNSQLIDGIKAQTPGASVDLQILRGGQQMEVTVPLMQPATPGDPPRIGITIQSAGTDVKLPFPVKIVPNKIAGGPSAGLMFTLTVYDMVTPKDLTMGRVIAGTGTINLDGTVGPIGGVQQKVAAAEGAGAQYFLSPPENYEDAVAVARNIKVIKVATAKQAIDFLNSLPPVN